MSGSISRSSRDAMRFTALTIVFGLHAVEGGGARLAPAPSDAGDLAAGRDIFSASTALCYLLMLLSVAALLRTGYSSLLDRSCWRSWLTILLSTSGLRCDP